MKERISVFVNGREVTIYGGMKVKHALIAYDPDVYDACREGRMAVRNQCGFPVGLEGAMNEGNQVFTTERVGTDTR